MSDVTPNYRVEMKKLQLHIKQQEAAIEREELAILEMQDKVVRSQQSIEAAFKAIDDFSKQLKSLESEHGTVTKKDIQQAAKALEG